MDPVTIGILLGAIIITWIVAVAVGTFVRNLRRRFPPDTSTNPLDKSDNIDEEALGNSSRLGIVMHNIMNHINKIIFPKSVRVSESEIETIIHDIDEKLLNCVDKDDNVTEDINIQKLIPVTVKKNKSHTGTPGEEGHVPSDIEDEETEETNQFLNFKMVLHKDQSIKNAKPIIKCEGNEVEVSFVNSSLK